MPNLDPRLWSACLAAQTGVSAAPMTWRARLFVILLGVAVLLFVINLVRTRKLKEEYALLWLAAAVMLIVAPLVVDWLDSLAGLIGIEYSPALLFLFATICIFFLFVQISISISRFSEQIKVLTQDLALLRGRVAELEQRAAGETSANDRQNDVAQH
jgi:hypothetical protein